MKESGESFKACAIALALLTTGVGSGEAQQPTRIGASLSLGDTYAPFDATRLRGYQLCVKHTNEKGGVLGRKVELVVENDRSQGGTAVRIYEKLIAQDKVDAILGPYSSPITEAAADVTEKHKMPMVCPGGNATSIFQKGRRFVFLVQSPAEAFLEGRVDMAAKRGLRTLAVINQDTLFPNAVAQGTIELAKKRGLQIVLTVAYPGGTTDLTAILNKVRAANPDVLAAATYFDDAVAITRRMKEMDVNPKMFGLTTGVDLPRFYEVLGRSAEFIYGATQWELDLMMLVREGVLIPVARRYPGPKEFVEAHRKEFPGAELSYHSAASYAGCQLLMEAMHRSGSIDGEKVRDAS